ncbi:tubulin delta chain isoform X1 [Syngnathus typhle]|uniref:tubulin delta chain isoform X1 n=1 Tax=Syngnathus typhle TaxID=161592 RepID=UPI002A6B55D2|nr:tubulin delta chain isoform X1 [Syngnathus typhle]
MSVVTVQLGQCGNQVGLELFDTLYNDVQACQKKTYAAASCERFFYQTEDADLVARAVLIDMEPKVINQNFSKTAKSGKWKYDDASSFNQWQGSGNNWANGFYIQGPRHRAAMEDILRREAERCDGLRGFLAMMSVAGGTGSGVGTYVTQCLRDVYPKSFIVNHLTWPYGTGEVIVQNYNSVLTLGRLYQLSDGLLVHENDTVHRICSQLLHIKDISIADINMVIAHQLGTILQPALTADSNGVYSRNPLGELVSALACHPEYKLLSVSTIPQMPSSSIAFTNFRWPALIKHLRQMLISNTKMEEGINWHVRPLTVSERTRTLTGSSVNTSLANLLILRGKDVFSAETGWTDQFNMYTFHTSVQSTNVNLNPTTLGNFANAALYSSWLSPKDAFNVWKCPVSFNKYEKTATLVSNSQALIEPLDNIVRKAWSMFAARAYIHQYTKFGISEEDFLESFAFVEQILSSYSQLGCNG